MLFSLVKLYARLALRIHCRRLVINNPRWLQARGPLLFAANHPNSFLDGIILTTLMDTTLYSLARGDAFTPRWKGWLRRLHLLPVYRTTEGTGNLPHNYTTFEACREVFAQQGAVLIFSEGGCINEWKLRPLRKGTARLAISAWEKGTDLTVVPVGFNYSSFKNFGKNVHLNFGTPLCREQVLAATQEGRQFAAFNSQLQQQLQQLVYELPAADVAGRTALFAVPVSPLKKVLLALPAALGWLLHAPLYYPVTWTASLFDSDHFDSVVVALLLLSYPLYLLLLVGILWPFAGAVAVLLLLLLPFGAWALVQLKPQVT